MRRIIRPVLLLSWLAVTGCAHHPSGSSPDATKTLTGVTWMWAYTITPVDVFTPSDPASYTLELGADGRAVIRADCNRGNGAYTLNGSELRFGPMAMTQAMCAPGSLDTRFAQQLAGSAHTFWHGDTLMIDLAMDSGTMRFVRAR
jgi:heat shock protein HslJ